MTISFRYARPDELEEVVGLACHSFPGGGRDREWWRSRFRETLFGQGPEILWVGEDAGRPIAACQLHRIAHYVAGEELPSMGLGTVAIAPTHRQRGLAGRMVATALEAAYERGDLLSSLYPFRASYYGRLGYGLCGDTHQYHVAPHDLPASEARASVELIQGPAAMAELAAFYDRWARTQTGQLKRGPRSWDGVAAASDRVTVGYRDAAGKLAGYAVATYPTALPPAERFLSVEEIGWMTSEARRGLYGWLHSMGDQWRAIALRTLPEHRLENWLREPRLGGGPVPQWGLWFPSAVLLRGPMFRLLNLGKAWSVRAVDPDVRLTLEVEVQDEQVPANAGTWRLTLGDGRVEVRRGGGGGGGRLRMNIQTLTRLYMGALPATAALQADLLEVDDAGLLPELDRALRLPGCWTFDRY